MSEEYVGLLSDFYELKKKYDKNFDRLKKKIKNNDELTLEQKKEKIRTLRPKCVKCKKPVGTIFDIKSESLRAICGANQPQIANEGYKPCSLNVNIKKPVSVDFETIIRETRDKRDKIMEKITLNKVKLLYVKESEKQINIVDAIEKMKLDYRTQSELLESYIKKHLELINRETESKTLFLKKYEVRKEILELIKDKKTKEAVELYIESYVPAVSVEMSSKYKHVYIDTDYNNVHYLKQISPEYTLNMVTTLDTSDNS